MLLTSALRGIDISVQASSCREHDFVRHFHGGRGREEGLVGRERERERKGRKRKEVTMEQREREEGRKFVGRARATSV